MPLPLEVVTKDGSKMMTLNKTGTAIESTTMPVIDPKVYYLKKVIYE
jgi:hypothetical protein